MLHIRFKFLNTPFRHPFTTAHGIKTHQPALLVAIQFNGLTGIGEAPAIHYYNVTTESMAEELQRKTPVLSRYAYTEPERFWHFCHHLFPNNPFLVCALDMAYWDLHSKMKGKRLYQLWDLDWSKRPPTDYTIGIDTPEVMLQKMREKPWPVYKIKVSEPAHLDVLRALRAETHATLRIDANAAWSLEQARELLPEMEKLNIELIEQPLHKDDLEGMKELKKLSSIPLVADESCVGEQDVKRCAEGFHGINIKLTKCSGITPALRMILEARTLGLKVMMGCMNETEIGTAAMANFLPLLDYADLDGPLLLDVPPLQQIRYDQGSIDWIS